jgi:uncharacterized protein (TIGR02597 family)
MKPYIPYSLILAAASCGMAFGAATAYTTPVGYVSLGNAGAVPANTDMPVAIPLERPSEWAGTVASVSGNDIILTGTTGFTDGQWVNATTPYVAKIGNGAQSGLIAMITANATVAGVSTLTVSLQNAADTLTGIVAGNSISIRKAWTVKSFFAGNTLPDYCEFGLWEGASGIDLAPNPVYYNYAGNWYDSNDADANNIVIYPNEGFRLRNTTATPISGLVVSGEVPTASSRVFVKGNTTQQDSRISYFSPVPEKLGDANIGAGDYDQILMFDVTQSGLDNAASLVYYYYAGIWYDSGDNPVSNTVSVQPGQAFIYRAEAGRADTVLSDLPSYVPGL